MNKKSVLSAINLTQFMKPYLFKFCRPFYIGLLLLIGILALGSCKKDKDDSPEYYLKFTADKNYELSFPQDTVQLYSGNTTDIHFSKMNPARFSSDNLFIDMGFTGPMSSGMHKLNYADVEIGSKYYSIYTNPFNPSVLKNGTINIEELNTQNKTAKGTFTFEVGSINLFQNTGYVSLPVSPSVISGSFKFRY